VGSAHFVEVQNVERQNVERQNVERQNVERQIVEISIVEIEMLTTQNDLSYPNTTWLSPNTCGVHLKNLSLGVALSSSSASSFAQFKTFSITEPPRLRSNLEPRLNSVFLRTGL
jgi:hypothetical protein